VGLNPHLKTPVEKLAEKPGKRSSGDNLKYKKQNRTYLVENYNYLSCHGEIF
jgi:hypothetical protein